MDYTYIIIGILIVFMIFFFYKKHIEHYSSESIENISKMYSDASNTASFNNLNITGEVSSLNVRGETKLYNNLYYIDTDIRRLLIGCTVYNGAVLFSNSFSKRDLHIGTYSINATGDFDNIIDIAVIYPGFGADFYDYNDPSGNRTYADASGSKASISNYGTLPLRVRFGTTIDVPADNTRIYNTDPNTYHINGTMSANSISEIDVFPVDINKWKAHRHS
jgi:hypothetical protein